MAANIFSIWMTILWSSVLIMFFYLVRTRTELLHICSISTIILLYLFCAIRMVFPLEMPWAHVVSGGTLYNKMYGLLACEVVFIRVYQLLFIIWMVGILYSLIRYMTQYYRAVVYFKILPQEEDKEGQKFIDNMEKSGNIRVIRTVGVKSPCCIGVFRKRIFLPNKSYSKEKLHYILLHEYTHLVRNDILLKLLIGMLCGIYWWNPFVYLLKKDLNQSMEIRCDLSVTRYLNENERADYLAVMLDAFRESGQSKKLVGAAGLAEEHSESLLERFRIVADKGIENVMRIEKQEKILAGIVMLFILIVSYSFIIQSSFETPMSEIETDRNIYQVDEENSYIIKQGDSYILHTAGTEVVISEETANMLLEEGFILRR